MHLGGVASRREAPHPATLSSCEPRGRLAECAEFNNAVILSLSKDLKYHVLHLKRRLRGKHDA
jgi:hypothetical protein